MKWFRLYDEVLDDPKCQRLSPQMFRHWINILCLANRSEPRGTLPAIADIAFGIRVNEAKAKTVIKHLQDAGLVDVGDGETLQVHNWHGRQLSSDNVSDRVARHRARNENVTLQTPAGNENVTLQTPAGNENVTLQTPARNDSETFPRARATDTDTDTDIDYSVSSPSAQKRAARPPGGVGAENPPGRTELPTNGPAQQLVKAGCTVDQIPDIVSWLWGQPRFRDGIDLGIVLAEFDKWASARSVPQDDAYIAALGESNIAKVAAWADGLGDMFGGESWVRNSLRRLAVEVPGLSDAQLKSGIRIGFDRAETSITDERRPIANPPAYLHSQLRQALTEQREVQP